MALHYTAPTPDHVALQHT